MNQSQACVIPTDTPGQGDTDAINWSSERYMLKAKKFEIKFKNDPAPLTMANAREVSVSGDPGYDSYFSIEITWKDAVRGVELRVYVYFRVTPDGAWQAFEARVYSPRGTGWVEPYFDESALQSLSGFKGECFKKGSLTVSNGAGTELRFTDLTIAALLPWSSEADFRDCTASAAVSAATTPPWGTLQSALTDNKADLKPLFQLIFTGFLLLDILSHIFRENENDN